METRTAGTSHIAPRRDTVTIMWVEIALERNKPAFHKALRINYIIYVIRILTST